MKTVVIWDGWDADIQFFVYDGDLRRFNNKYVNGNTTEEEDTEISNLMYHPETGKKLIETTKEFPIDAVKEGAFVIVTGFLP